MKKLLAEFFGTFWLVFGGCGSAVFAAAFPELGIGFTGVALAFGLTVLTMAYAVGHVSGAHFNPAVSIGLWAGGKFPAKDLIGYILAQILIAIPATPRPRRTKVIRKSFIKICFVQRYRFWLFLNPKFKVI